MSSRASVNMRFIVIKLRKHFDNSQRSSLKVKSLIVEDLRNLYLKYSSIALRFCSVFTTKYKKIWFQDKIVGNIDVYTDNVHHFFKKLKTNF